MSSQCHLQKPTPLPVPHYSDISRYKYQLKDDYTIQIDILGTDAKFSSDICTVSLTAFGLLTIGKGFRWDGNSAGFKTGTWVIAALVHDSLYMLIRHGKLATHPYKELADRQMYDLCLASGMNKLRAWISWKVVGAAGLSSTTGDE
jgi:hypothetical protein